MEGFDVPDSTVRVVVTRLRKEGWLTARRDGRETVYALTGAAWRLLDEGRARIFARATEPWDGCWHLVVYSVPESERSLREQLRKRLTWLGFGPLTSGVWLCPHDRVAEVRASFADQPAVRLDALHARSEGLAADRDMAARAWDLAALDRDYADLLRRYGPLLARLRADPPAGRQALVERVQLVHDYRLFPFRDPDLATELLPEGWSGRAAHEAFLRIHGLLREPAEAHVDEVVGRSG
jgi:phenylacetic acid degradation operon negative regulatory protein